MKTLSMRLCLLRQSNLSTQLRASCTLAAKGTIEARQGLACGTAACGLKIAMPKRPDDETFPPEYGLFTLAGNLSLLIWVRWMT